MTRNAKNMLRDAVIPVLLGDCADSELLALRLYFRLGVTSYVCDTKKSLLSLINPSVRFFPLFVTDTCENALNSLSYISDNTDYLPILVPCTAKYARLIERNRDFFESRFIISDTDSLLLSKPLSELL